MAEDRNATVKGPYLQSSIQARIEAFFLDNLGKVATREQLIEVATDPRTGKSPENWHQRLSELRIDKGYTAGSTYLPSYRQPLKLRNVKCSTSSNGTSANSA